VDPVVLRARALSVLKHRLSKVIMMRQKFVGILAILIAVASAAPAQAESRGYIIDWFATATNASDYKTNCPEDRNGGVMSWLRRDMIAAGYSAPDADKILTTVVGDMDLPEDVATKIFTRAKVNGRSVNVRSYPEAVPDPRIETVTGKYAHGFDLGVADRTNKFIDPDTKQPVDNQLWRAVGCTATFRADPPRKSYYEANVWDNNLYEELVPHWALQITGDDLSKDGKVTLTLSRTTRELLRDAAGQFLKNASYVVDPSPDSHNVLQGEIKNGILTIEPTDIRLRGFIYGEIALRNVHMRMWFDDDKVVGYWGGFMPWLPFAYAYCVEPGSASDCTGIYHSVKRLADASPDPVTGRNTEISSTFRIEAVPAYLLDVDGRELAQPAIVH
jgi:hypothetical protein